MLENAIMRGFRRIACGFWGFDGVLLSENHPTKITISAGALEFTYAVGKNEAVRSFSLERSDGKIVAFTNPDGTRTEVLRNG